MRRMIGNAKLFLDQMRYARALRANMSETLLVP